MHTQLKGIGMVLIVVSCSGLGIRLAHLCVERIRQCRQVEQCLRRLLGEIRFHQLPMEEALREAGKTMGNQGFADFFMRLSQRLASIREGGKQQEEENITLPVLWKEELDRYLEGSLLQEEQEMLLRLGQELGTLDLEEQVRSLQHFLDQWCQYVEEIQRRVEPHGRLYRGVGISVGVFLAILLL